MRMILLVGMLILTLDGFCQDDSTGEDRVRPGYYFKSVLTGNDSVQDPDLLFEARMGGYIAAKDAKIFSLNQDTIVLLATLYEDIYLLDHSRPVSYFRSMADSLGQLFDQSALMENTHRLTTRIKGNPATEFDSTRDHIDYLYADSDGVLVYCMEYLKENTFQKGLLKWIGKTKPDQWEILIDEIDVKTVVRRPNGFLLYGPSGPEEEPWIVDIRNGAILSARKAKPCLHLFYFDAHTGNLLDTVSLYPAGTLEQALVYDGHILLFFHDFASLIDCRGNSVWTRKFDFSFLDLPLADERNNLYFVTHERPDNFYLNKMGKDLTLIWKTFLAFAGDRDTRITDLKLMHTGGLLVAIQTKKGYQQSEEAWSRLLRIDTAGETVWEYTMEGPAIEDGPPLHYIEKVLEGQDHDLYVLASSSSVGHVSQYYSITRLDSNGVMRSRNFLDKETSYSELLETKQGRIMMVGKLGTYDEKGGLLTTIDNKGRITDNILYPAEGGVFQKVIPLRSGFLLFGFAESPYTQASNYWLIATKQ